MTARHVVTLALFAAVLLATPPAARGQTAKAPPQAPPVGGGAAKMVDDDDLLVGPQAAELTYLEDGQVMTAKVEIQYLTRTAVFYREYDPRNPKAVLPDVKSSATAFTELKSRLLRDVKLADPVGGEWVKWAWDEKAGKFTGHDAIAPAAKATLRAGVPKFNMDLELTVRAERLHLALDTALWARSRKAVDALLDDAAAFKRAGAAAKADADVVRLFDLKEYAGRQQARVEAYAKDTDELHAKRVDAEQDLRAIQANYQMESAGGAGQVLIGLFRSDSYWASDRRAGFELMESGRDAVLEAARRKGTLEQSVKEDEGRYEADALKKLKRSRDDFRDEQKKLADHLGGCWDGCKVDRAALKKLDDLADDLRTSRDHASAIERLDARLTYLDGKGVCDVGVLCARLDLQAGLLTMPPPSAGEQQKRAEELGRLAEEAVAATDRLPQGEAFDADRVALLGKAGQIIHRAINYSHAHKWAGTRTWSAFYDPRADAGVRLLDQALRLHDGKAADRDGSIRAARAWLLLQRGLKDRALAAAQEVEKMRGKDPESAYNLAKVYCATGNARDARKHFDFALANGLSDLRAVQADGDVAALRDAAFEGELKSPKLTVKHYPTARAAAAIQNYTVEITNAGRVPLVVADFTFKAVTNGKTGLEKQMGTFKLDYLAPGKTYYWVDGFKATALEMSNRSGVRVKLAGLPPAAKPVVFDSINGTYTPYWWGWWGR